MVITPTYAAQWRACVLTPKQEIFTASMQFVDMGFARSNPSALREAVGGRAQRDLAQCRRPGEHGIIHS